MEDIITRTRSGKTWTRKPMESKIVPKTFTEDRRAERPVLKCNKCGRNSNLANNLTKKTKMEEAQIIEEVKCSEEKGESYQDSEISEDTLVEEYPIENITAFFEVIEVHTNFPKNCEDFYNLISIQEARMFKTKPAKGTG
ncbi:hypothetical protein O181_002153 [Austropuccinia psidii MF-1]|uniref:Uncharacterized protein n=1 Tax=Austropuccinia psidii MF-1 TaxID=1389203 RepID=A0A9Q3BBX3_9BASI|nr:hypothetical protein [Austropuccinia psidii MF-1]